MKPRFINGLKLVSAAAFLAIILSLAFNFATNSWSPQHEAQDYVSETNELSKEAKIPKLETPIAAAPVPMPTTDPAPEPKPWWTEVPVTPRYDQPPGKPNAFGSNAAFGTPNLRDPLKQIEFPRPPELPQTGSISPITVKPILGTSSGGLMSGETTSGATGAVTGAVNSIPSTNSLLKR